MSSTAGPQNVCFLQNQWIPPAYPPTSFRAPLNTFMPHSTDISMLMPSESSKRTETKSVAVQTAGLFYPSQRKIDQIQKEVEDKMTFEKQMRDRRPVTSAVSPGRGTNMFVIYELFYVNLFLWQKGTDISRVLFT